MSYDILRTPDTKSGIGIFQEQLCQNLEPENTHIIERKYPHLPFSRTLESFQYTKRVKKKLENSDSDKLLVTSQELMQFDPREIDQDVVVYVHDIFPATSTYREYRNDTLMDRLDGYLSTVMAVRYVKMMHHADKIICASKTVEKQVEQLTDIQAETAVVRQGIDNLPDDHTRKMPGDDRIFDLIYVGSMLPRKNPELVRRCLNYAKEQGFQVATVSFEEHDNLPGRTYTDVSDEFLAWVYSRSRYILNMSYAEGFGRPPVEAQRYGCVPIAPDDDHSREIYGDPGIHFYAFNGVENLTIPLNRDTDLYEPQDNSKQYRWSATAYNILCELGEVPEP